MVSIYWGQIARELIRSGHRSGAKPEVLEQLKEILAPVDSLIELAYTFPKNSPDRSRLLNESHRLATSGKLAQSIFDSIGTEFAIELALKNNAESIEHSLKSLGTMEFLKRIEERAIGQAGLISDQRLNQLKAIFNEADTKREEINRKFVGRIEEISDKRWKTLLAVLDDRQKNDAESLIGKPIQWHRFLEQPVIRDLDLSLVSGVGHYGLKADKMFDDFQQPLKLTDQELRGKGLEPIDPLVYALLQMPIIVDELQTTEKQTADLSDMRDSDWKNNGIVLYRNANQRFDSLLQMDASYPESLLTILTPPQEEWLRQVELQIRVGKQYEPTVGLTHPKVAARLDLKQSQVKEVNEIGKKFDKELEPILREFNHERKSMEDDFAIRLVTALNLTTD
jgi:hypothetical protein